MKVTETELEGLLIIEPQVHKDSRGYFMETYQANRYKESQVPAVFIQDNLSKSVKGTLRGLHYQLPPFDQAKLVQVIVGEVFDVAVDIRKSSPTFGKSKSVVLNEANKAQFFIPKGFAHGFCVLSEYAIFHYKCDNYYSPDHERGILWSDKKLGIDWPEMDYVISEKDKNYSILDNIGSANLPS